MLVKVDNDINLIINNVHDFNKYWEDLLKQFSQNGRLISYVIINKESYYENFQEQIVRQIDNINELFIYSISELELLEETLKEITRYSEVLIHNCNSIGSAFYAELSEEEWQRFNQLLAGFSWISEAIFGCVELMSRIGVYPELTASFEETSKQLQQHLRSMEEAMGEKEYVAVADIIKFEIVELFTSLATMSTKRG